MKPAHLVAQGVRDLTFSTLVQKCDTGARKGGWFASNQLLGSSGHG